MVVAVQFAKELASEKNGLVHNCKVDKILCTSFQVYVKGLLFTKYYIHATQ